jgi:hypothetical protein
MIYEKINCKFCQFVYNNPYISVNLQLDNYLKEISNIYLLKLDIEGV